LVQEPHWRGQSQPGAIMTLSTRTLVRAALALLLTACGGKNEQPPDPQNATECKVSGCSGQACVAADQEPLATTCEWLPEYACYQKAECAVQSNGQCGWTPSDELETCFATARENGKPVPQVTQCEVGGCSGELCVPEGADGTSDCVWLEEYTCYNNATCEPQADGECGWTPSDDLAACLTDARDTTTPTVDAEAPVLQETKCFIAGCSGELCLPEGADGTSDCVWLEEYTCYNNATCEPQPDGECGWTPSEELDACLAHAREDAGTSMPPLTGCEVGGCSSELCLPAGSDLEGDCLWLDEFACYNGATCEIQPDGECGWTPTQELLSCIDAAREVDASVDWE
jgi:eight-cysteine-cluster-containing protein